MRHKFGDSGTKRGTSVDPEWGPCISEEDVVCSFCRSCYHPLWMVQRTSEKPRGRTWHPARRILHCSRGCHTPPDNFHQLLNICGCGRCRAMAMPCRMCSDPPSNLCAKGSAHSPDREQKASRMRLGRSRQQSHGGHE